MLDPVRFRLAIREAQARLDGALEDLKLKRNDARRRMGLGGIVSAEEQEVFNSNVATQIASVDAARAALDVAKLNLQRSVLYSPVNGYITNLNLRVGDYASAGQARMAVIDSDSYWVYGYFEETKMWGVHVGDEARVKLMGYKPILTGHVVSIARGINDTNGTPDKLGLQDVNPIFTWVRLAQRIPVRIHIDHVPDSVTLAAGMTATVSVGPEPRGRRGKLTTWLQRSSVSAGYETEHEGSSSPWAVSGNIHVVVSLYRRAKLSARPHEGSGSVQGDGGRRASGYT